MAASPEPPVSIVTAGHLEGEAAAAVSRIFEAGFPPSEREPADLLLAGIAAGRLRCRLALLDDRPVGLSVFTELRGVRAVYLEYLVIDEHHRGRGIGSRLLRDLCEQSRAAAGPPDGVVLEVEPAGEAVGAERDHRTRRIRFYERGGATVVDCAPRYRVPNLAEPGLVWFSLMWLTLSEAGPQLRGERLRDVVTAMMTQGYGLDQDGQLVRSVVADLPC
jgi:ribosomal protein S18 acetylase RimI-like enzyme